MEKTKFEQKGTYLFATSYYSINHGVAIVDYFDNYGDALHFLTTTAVVRGISQAYNIEGYYLDNGRYICGYSEHFSFFAGDTCLTSTLIPFNDFPNSDDAFRK